MTKNTRNSRVGGTRRHRKTPKNPSPYYQPKVYLVGEFAKGFGLFISNPKTYRSVPILVLLGYIAIYNHDLFSPLTVAAFTAAKTYLFRGIK